MIKHILALMLVILFLGAGFMPATAQDTAECEGGFRLFDHEFLATDPVCIPENPQRILALEISALELVLFTDKELVGTAGWLHSEVPVLMPELAPALEGIAKTGYPANLEAAIPCPLRRQTGSTMWIHISGDHIPICWQTKS